MASQTRAVATSVDAGVANLHSGGNRPWTSPGSTLTSNNAYASVVSQSTGTGTDYSYDLVMTQNGNQFSIPSGATINGIEVRVEAKKTGSLGSGLADIQLRKSGAYSGTKKSPNTGFTTTDSTYTQGSSVDLWGGSWSATDINATDFGVGIASFMNRSFDPELGQLTTAAYIDYVEITVYYTATDSTPDQFTFTDVTGVTRSTTQTSNQITISGINTTANVSVSGGTYSKNGGAYTSSAGTCVNGDIFTVQHTSSSAFSTVTNTTLTVDIISDTFSSTTEAQDTQPDSIGSFTPVTGASLSTVYTSNAVTPTGYNDTATVTTSGTGGSIGVDINSDGNFQTSRSISPGQTLRIRQTSSASGSTTTTATATIGTVNSTFNVTTTGADITPDAFAFTDQTNLEPLKEYMSNSVTITGINTGASVSLSGDDGTGYFSIASGAYQQGVGTITNGQTLQVKAKAPGGPGTTRNVTVTVGTGSDIWSLTSAAGAGLFFAVD